MSEENKIPLWNKYLLTINEAADYFSIGRHHLRRIVNANPGGDFYLMDGSHVLIKRIAFEKFIDETECI